MKKGISENENLKKPISNILYPKKCGIVWDDES